MPDSGFDRDANGKPVIADDPAAIYAFGHLIRSAEEILLDLFSKGQLAGTTHTCLGQELCQMSVVRALDHPGDAIFSNHRNHGHFLTYSGAFAALFAEIMGREGGICGGHGGSQHLAHRGFHSSGVQGGMTAIAVGQALARKLNGERSIVAVVIGDGTLGQGLVYEALNLAAVWDVPVLFVVENNGIAQTTGTDTTTAGSLTARGEAFGIRTWRVSDDAPDLFRVAGEAVSTVRSTRSPGFLVVDTMRLGPHSKGDDPRTEAELDAVRARDPLARVAAVLPDDERLRIEADNAVFLKSALARAMESRPARFDAVPFHVFGEDMPEPSALPATRAAAERTVRQSLNETLHRLLQTHEDVVLLGEDLHDPYGGAFKVTEGLSSAFGERVISTPISEAGIVGSGIGLAMAGKRPIVEIMFADFISLGMDQLYNHAVKFPALFDETEVPMVVRTACGGGRGYGATHSQIPESLCASVPGLTVVSGSHRHDMEQLLEHAAMRWDHPVVFLEHKLLYSLANRPGPFAQLPAAETDRAARLFPTLVSARDNVDVTIVAYGGMAPVAEAAAQTLERDEEIGVEIVLPSLIAPLPRQTLLNALLKRERIVIVEESATEFGVGAEIAALLAEAGFAGNVLRIGAPSIPVPSARSLEEQVLPGPERVVAEICRMFEAP